MGFVIDRFEGEFALCETESGEVELIARDALPEDAAEGDILREDGEGGYAADPAEKEQRLEEATCRLCSLFSKE